MRGRPRLPPLARIRPDWCFRCATNVLRARGVVLDSAPVPATIDALTPGEVPPPLVGWNADGDPVRARDGGSDSVWLAHRCGGAA